MIYVDGLKYFYGENNKVDINKLSQEDIEKVNKYFISMNYEINLEIFPTMNEYKFKFPNYFKRNNDVKELKISEIIKKIKSKKFFKSNIIEKNTIKELFSSKIYQYKGNRNYSDIVFFEKR